MNRLGWGWNADFLWLAEPSPSVGVGDILHRGKGFSTLQKVALQKISLGFLMMADFLMLKDGVE